MSLRKVFFALLFFAGGFAHELRNPITCELVTTRAESVLRKRK